MKLYLQVALVIASTLTHMVPVLGLACTSECAACWNDQNLNVDIKFSCANKDEDCGSCPVGYHSSHCATNERCV